ncbi:MAG: hypothetical protein LBV32_03025 [Tannerellaceae bacterium]|jgi:hypothetical protein|nr:hypothetical protein [Tannerellaceae bacterium]
MKRNLLLLIALIACTALLRAQEQRESNGGKLRPRIDIQLVQHIGLDAWSDAGYVTDGLPPVQMTEIRGVLGLHVKPAFNLFGDMGIGITPASAMKSFDLGRMPLPNSGTGYYLREMLSETGTGKTAAHFKMTAGWFGNFRVGERCRIMPHAGLGVLSMEGRSYEMILKEDGSNAQYRTTYAWGRDFDYDEDYPEVLPMGYLTGRVNVQFPLTRKLDLMLGLEYTHFLTEINFQTRYVNTFNENIRKDITVKGNRANMIGLSVTLLGSR